MEEVETLGAPIEGGSQKKIHCAIPLNEVGKKEVQKSMPKLTLQMRLLIHLKTCRKFLTPISMMKRKL